ncbi:MAG: hypothetical protein AAGF97_00660 [Planctomycetota bacterium]
MNAGKLVTLGILGLALALGLFAWLYHKGRSDRAIDYWGAENAVRVRRASDIRLVRLRPWADGDATREAITIDGKPWLVEDEREITATRGLVHLRQALVENTSFDWSRPGPDELLVWDYVLRFRNAPDEPPLEVAIGLDSACLQCLDGRPTIGLEIAQGIRAFIQDAISPPEPVVPMNDSPA